MGLRLMTKRSQGMALVLTLMLLAGCEKPKSGPDLSTPKAAAITFTRALEQGDTTTALAAANAGGIERDLVEAMAESSSGLKILEKAANAKFGDDAKRMNTLRGPSNIVSLLMDADVDENGDRAKVVSKNGQDSLQLQKTNGQWKVDIGALVRGQDISHAVPMFVAAGQATRKVADDINSGKCTTVDAALMEMATEINARMPGRHPQSVMSIAPTTAASVSVATAPATRP